MVEDRRNPSDKPDTVPPKESDARAHKKLHEEGWAAPRDQSTQGASRNDQAIDSPRQSEGSPPPRLHGEAVGAKTLEQSKLENPTVPKPGSNSAGDAAPEFDKSDAEKNRHFPRTGDPEQLPQEKDRERRSEFTSKQEKSDGKSVPPPDGVRGEWSASGGRPQGGSAGLQPPKDVGGDGQAQKEPSAPNLGGDGQATEKGLTAPKGTVGDRQTTTPTNDIPDGEKRFTGDPNKPPDQGSRPPVDNSPAERRETAVGPVKGDQTGTPQGVSGKGAEAGVRDPAPRVEPRAQANPGQQDKPAQGSPVPRTDHPEAKPGSVPIDRTAQPDAPRQVAPGDTKPASPGTDPAPPSARPIKPQDAAPPKSDTAGSGYTGRADSGGKIDKSGGESAKPAAPDSVTRSPRGGVPDAAPKSDKGAAPDTPAAPDRVDRSLKGGVPDTVPKSDKGAAPDTPASPDAVARTPKGGAPDAPARTDRSGLLDRPEPSPVAGGTAEPRVAMGNGPGRHETGSTPDSSNRPERGATPDGGGKSDRGGAHDAASESDRPGSADGSVRPDKNPVAGGTAETTRASTDGAAKGSKVLDGTKDSGPGRSGNDGTKVAGDVRVSSDAAGRSGVDAGKVGSATQHGFGTKETTGTGGTTTGARGIDMPIGLPPGFPGIPLGIKNTGNPGADAGIPVKGGSGSGGGGSPVGRGDKDGTTGGAVGDRAVDPSGRGVQAGKPGELGANQTGGRAGVDGTKTGTGAKDDRSPEAKGGKSPDVPVALPPGILAVDFGGIIGRKPNAATEPTEKTGPATVVPGEKGGQSAAPGAKPGMPGSPDKSAEGRAPFIPVNIPAGFGFDQAGKAPSTPPAAGDRTPFISVNVPPGLAIDQTGKAPLAAPGGDAGRRNDLPAAASQTGKAPVAVPGGDAGRKNDLPATASPDAGHATVRPDKATTSAAEVAEKPAAQAPRSEGEPRSLGADKTQSVRVEITPERQHPETHGLPGLELTGRLDSGPWEWPKSLERTRSESGEFRAKPISDEVLSKDHPDRVMAGQVQRAMAAAQPTDEKLIALVKDNRQVLEEVIRAQGESNAALQELAQLLHQLDATSSSDETTEVVADYDSGTVDEAEDTTEMVDAGIIRREHRQRERSQTTGQEDERNVYIVHEGDTLESIGDDLFREKRVGALIHELNKDIIPSTYLYDRIIVELKEGMVLHLPTSAELQVFFDSTLGSNAITFEYSRGVAAAEQELADWEQSHGSKPMSTWWSPSPGS